jgi:hypothetical protein
MSDQIRAYIARAPEAISGSGGHSTTLRVARALFNGFELTRDDVLRWLKVYNARLSDKWTDRELEHKADSAARATYDKPAGWMLSTHATGFPNSPKAGACKKVAVFSEKPTPVGVKKAKKYVLATHATGFSHSPVMCAHTHTRAQSHPESKKSVASVPKYRQPDREYRKTVASVPKAPQWTDEQIRLEHRPLWRMDGDGRWKPLNDAARKLVQAAQK